MRDVLVIHGDCQASYLEPRLARMSFLNERYDIHFVSIIQPWMVGQPNPSPLPPEVWERCTLFWRQVGPDTWPAPPDGYLGRMARGVRTVHFPSFWFAAAWALGSEDPVMAAKPPAHPVFPYQDRHFLAAGRAAATLHDAPAAYDRLVRDRWPAFERMLDHSVQVMAARERDCEVQLTGYVLSNFKIKRLLWNPTNPTDALAKEMVRRLVRASDIDGVADDAALAAAIAAGFDATDPPHFQRFPIPPAVAEGFGLQWWRDDDRYWIRLLPQPVTWREYVRRYIEARLAAGG